MWIELTNSIILKIKHFAKRKIKLQDNREVWAIWDSNERCFFWDDGESAVYVDEPQQRPTHVWRR